MKLYYIIPLNYCLSGHPEDCQIKLYHFQERLSLWYNHRTIIRTEIIFQKTPCYMHDLACMWFLVMLHAFEFSRVWEKVESRLKISK